MEEGTKNKKTVFVGGIADDVDDGIGVSGGNDDQEEDDEEGE